MAVTLLQEIDLHISSSKSKAIVIRNGKLIQATPLTTCGTISSISADEEIKYLGATFNQTLVFNSNQILTKLHTNLDTLATTPLLQPHQKLTVINQFIGPTLIYPLQTSSLEKIPKQFLVKADNMIRSAIKQILQPPSDTPNSMLYTSYKYKGLQILCTSWEAFLQQLNINRTLKYANQPHLNLVRDFEHINIYCLATLKIDTSLQDLKVQQLRQHLHDKAFTEWCSYPHKGKGVELFAEVPATNKWMPTKQNLFNSEWRDMLKMIAMVPSVRSFPGRSTSTSHCRYCSEYESLAHVLGKCSYEELLRIQSHIIVRTLLANVLRSQGLEVQEEVHSVADNDSNRRIDIIAINRKKRLSEIIDPIIRFEISGN